MPTDQRRDKGEGVHVGHVLRSTDECRGDDVGQKHTERIRHHTDGGGQTALIVGKPAAGDLQKRDIAKNIY